MENVVFVEEVPQDLYCPLCLDVLTEPCLTDCGHHFCNGCLAPLLKDKDPCPVCRETEFESMRNLAIERRISNMKVYCSFRDQGCEWIGTRKELEGHVKSACSFSSLPCLFQKFGCSERLANADLEMHLKLNLAEHMVMVTEAMKTQQQSMMASIEVKDQKIAALEQRLKFMERKYGDKFKLKSDITWNPLPIAGHTLIGGFNGNIPKGETRTYKFPLPMYLIPAGSREVLIHVMIRAGFSLPDNFQPWLMVYVKDREKRLYKMTRITQRKQDAFSDNTENMWFPLPPDRSVYLEVPRRPKPIQKNATCNIYVIGYR